MCWIVMFKHLNTSKARNPKRLFGFQIWFKAVRLLFDVFFSFCVWQGIRRFLSNICDQFSNDTSCNIKKHLVKFTTVLKRAFWEKQVIIKPIFTKALFVCPSQILWNVYYESIEVGIWLKDSVSWLNWKAHST